MEILRAQNIQVKYRDKEIIKDMSLGINKGTLLSVIGPNGSGKTTLLRVLSRNMRPERGAVFFNGDNIFSMRTKAVARQMAILTQANSCPGDITVKDLVMYGRFSHREWWKGKDRQDDEIVEWAMERTSIQSLSHRDVGTLSGGERQRVWIAMALAQKPQLLFLDEPATYLDISHQLEVLELVHSLNRNEGITVVMVLHDINQAARYSDELLVIKDGGIYARGLPEEVLTCRMLQEVYKVEAEVHADPRTGKPVFFPLGLKDEAICE